MLNHWSLPESFPRLHEGQVQLWRLFPETSYPGEAAQILSLDECARAARMRAGAPREEFVAGRSLLRRLIGGQLNVSPSSFSFAEGGQGKPRLAAHPHLEFNLSHSHGLILIALSRAGAVGVDVEYRDEAFGSSGELIQVAREGLTPFEVEKIKQAPDEATRLTLFYRAWTRREAVVKGDGRGLAAPLQYRIGSEQPDGTCRVLLREPHGQREQTWFVREISAGPSHHAALATLDRGIEVACFDWQDSPVAEAR
jgi:4'-phosphopantetheinyl transferase